MKRIVIDQKIAVCVVFVAALFMSIMDGTIINVALATIQQDFGASSSAINAIVVIYLICIAVVIPASGWLSDRWDTKWVFLTSLGLFTLASMACGLAQNIEQLMLTRAAQGIAAGALMPVGTTMLFRTFPPHQRIQVSRILIIPTVIAPAVGPVLGGYLVDRLSWHWVFFVNGPIGLAALIFGALWLQTPKREQVGAFDWLGFILAGAGFAALLYTLTEGASKGWSSALILSSAAIGILSLAALVFVELAKAKPMLDLRLFSIPLFRVSNLVAIFGSAAFTGILFLMPQFLQNVAGASALESGLTTSPEAIGVVLSSQLVARLYPKVGPRRLTFGGVLGVAVMIGLMSTIDAETNLWLVRALMFGTGVGMAYLFLPIEAAVFAQIPHASTGQASAIFNMQQQLGSALGVAILGSVLALNHSGTGINQNAQSYQYAFMAAAVLAFISACVALFIRDRDAAATMAEHGEHSELGHSAA
ncbi:MDR family MFS transporter [Herpetosiphon sp. NSE202]|uniref:MDR family MFS transporter n=1 Tax=Herpetosiphon sp. NSE202 TaxID=3351349 RepID=UPI00364102F3